MLKIHRQRASGVSLLLDEISIVIQIIFSLGNTDSSL